MGSLMDRGTQYIQLVKVLYCILPNFSPQLPTFPEDQGFEPQTSEVGGKYVTPHSKIKGQIKIKT